MTLSLLRVDLARFFSNEEIGTEAVNLQRFMILYWQHHVLEHHLSPEVDNHQSVENPVLILFLTLWFTICLQDIKEWLLPFIAARAFAFILYLYALILGSYLISKVCTIKLSSCYSPFQVILLQARSQDQFWGGADLYGPVLLWRGRGYCTSYPKLAYIVLYKTSK